MKKTFILAVAAMMVILLASSLVLTGCQSAPKEEVAKQTEPEQVVEQAAEFTGPSYYVDTTWLASRLEDKDMRIVDVRAKEEYDKGHIKNAVNLPIVETTDQTNQIPGMVADAKTIETKLSDLGIGNDTKVIAYDEGSFFSGRAVWVLHYYGHEDAAVLDGGLKKWQQDGQPVVTEAPVAAKAVFTATPNPDINATTAQVKGWVENKNSDVVIVDTRPYKEWVVGNIPGAERMDWVEILDPVDPPMIMTAQAMQDVLDKHGITKDKEIVLY